MTNHNRRISRYAWLAAFLFFVGIFVPEQIGIDGFDGGFALSTFSLLFSIAGVITAVLYGGLAKQQDRLIDGQSPLARWVYTPEEWSRFAMDEVVRDQQAKTFLFYMVAFWAVVCGVGFWIYDPEGGKYVALVMLGLVVLIGAVAFLSIRITRHRLLHHQSEVLISQHAAYVNGQMHSWTLVGSSLVDVRLLELDPQSTIEIDYMGGKTDYSVRIPVPTGKADEAKNVVNALIPLIKS